MFILQVFSQFDGIKDAVSFHLVEVSPKLSEIQHDKLCQKNEICDDKHDIYYKKGISRFGKCVYWYKQLSDVPRATSFFIAHEFFDALPIHKFQVKCVYIVLFLTKKM